MNYLTYGAGRCRACGLRGASHQIQESQQSRFHAMRFVAEMAAQPMMMPAGGFIMTDPNAHKFMVGVLCASGQTLVACSGNHDNFAPMIAAAARFGYTVAQYQAPPYRARGGGALTLAEVQGTHAGGHAPQPGRCAAPKLINEAIARNLHLNGAWRNWAMTETYYQPSTARRTHELYNVPPPYTHGLSADHCATCANLVWCRC
ncbi:hypothetical protein D1610_15720 [Sphingomonas gilva]|uniref:Uncharacterized protein n=1 Tax=Sphingomonas gilva TaxID=2305907 RepID=A0A396RMZ2_9SPHN|nr:hypothetical protein [Sphingomonas gilva]RHW16532.1 hypothetical protein D1610_15720 [Sphingomonas gilva]